MRGLDIFQVVNDRSTRHPFTYAAKRAAGFNVPSLRSLAQRPNVAKYMRVSYPDPEAWNARKSHRALGDCQRITPPTLRCQTFMPTQAIHSALLVLGNTEGLPWTTPSWQALTKVYGIPWDISGDAPDEARSTIVPEWTIRVTKEVEVFVQKVWSIPEAEQDNYIVAVKGDNNSAGRKAWKDWVKARLPKWTINKVIDETLMAEGRGPYQVMAERGTRKVRIFVPVAICTLAQNSLHPAAHPRRSTA